MGIWNNFKKGLKGKEPNKADVRAKQVYSRVYQKTYATERMKYMSDKAKKDAIAKARSSTPQGTGFGSSAMKFLKGTPEQQAKARAYLQSGSVSKSTMGSSSQSKKDAEFLQKLMRS